MKITVLGAISVIAVVAIVIAVAMAITKNNEPKENSGAEGFPNL